MAWKGEWWKRVDRKRCDLEHLRTRPRLLAVDQSRAVGDPDDAARVPLGHVIDAEQ